MAEYTLQDKVAPGDTTKFVKSGRGLADLDSLFYFHTAFNFTDMRSRLFRSLLVKWKAWHTDTTEVLKGIIYLLVLSLLTTFISKAIPDLLTCRPLSHGNRLGRNDFFFSVICGNFNQAMNDFFSVICWNFNQVDERFHSSARKHCVCILLFSIFPVERNWEMEIFRPGFDSSTWG